jgi:hypothetical protein
MDIENGDHHTAPRRTTDEQAEYDRKEAETRAQLTELQQEALRTYPGASAPQRDEVPSEAVISALSVLRDGDWSVSFNSVKAALKAALPHLTAEPTAAYQRGVEAGRAEQVTSTLEVTSGPTDYEVWRDAWNLAAATSSPDFSPGEIRDNAEWFHDLLKAGRPLPSEPDCPHCGADSSMEHNDDCPNAEPEDQAEIDQASERESERVEQERFEQGLGTYPGHDMSVTTGGCGPARPCPACQERIRRDADIDPYIDHI